MNKNTNDGNVKTRNSTTDALFLRLFCACAEITLITSFYEVL
jgi:hypothetical protein